MKTKLNKPFRDKTPLFLAVLLLGPSATVFAQSLWTGGTGDFNNAASWTGPYIGASNPNCSNDSGTNNVVLIQPGDPIWQHGDTLAGNAANTSGAYLQTGSTNNTGGGNWMRLAVGTGGYGSYILSNGVVNVGGETHIGEVGVGYLEIDGGIFNAGVNGGNPFCAGDGDFGPNNNTAVGTVVMNGGTINTTHEMWFGEGGNDSGRRGTGHFIMHGGVINAGNWFVLGRFGGGGDMYMDGGTINKANNGNWQMAVGTMNSGTIGATAYFTQVGGTINCASEYQIATDNNFTICTNDIGGNAILTVDNWLAVGRFGGMGTLNISGNAAITKTGVNGGNVTIASGSSIGVINQNGGTFTNTATQSWIAENGTGYWNMTSGTTVLGVIHLTQNAGASGTFNLTGGNLTATEITDNGGNGTFNFDGGTLHAGASSTVFMHGINGGANLNSPATIDTAGFNDTISQVLMDGGLGNGLIKNGTGTLTLSGANAYSGATTVNAGTLATTTASFANGAYTVADGAGLGLLVLAANAQLNQASLTLGITTGATLNLDLGSFGNPTSAPFNVSGNLAVNGNTTVNVTDALPQLGQFPLIKYGSKSGSGTFTIGTLPTGVAATIVINTGNNSIDLNVTSVALDIWNGLAGGNWDINVTTNWTAAGDGLPTKYTDGSSVVFNDTVTGTNTVNLVANVQPGSITIQNDATNYTLVGSGRINGTVGLNKQGAASFTIGNTNGYTGRTVLSGGTLVVSNLANGGTPSAIGASSASPTNLVLAGGALSYVGPTITNDRGYNLQYGYSSNGVVLNSSIDLQGNLTLTGRATAAQNTSFVKSGPASLTYAGSVTNELSGGAFPGYNILSGTVVFDGTSGGQTNHSQSEFWVGASTSSGGDLLLTNTTLRVDSWLAVGRGNGPNGYLSTITLNNSTVYCGNYSMGYWANIPGNLSSSILTLNNSKMVDPGAFNIAESAGSSATIYLNGTSMITENGPFLPGMQSGATGTVVMADSSVMTNNLWASIGANGEGNLVMKNNALLAEGSDFNLGDYGATGTTGNLTIQDNAQIILTGGGSVFVGKTASSIGNVIQTGGTINARNAGVFQLAQQAGSVGTWLQSGGTNYAGGWVSIGRGANSGDLSPNGLLVVSGGLFDQSSTGNGLIVGEQGTGTLTISNAGVVVSEANNIGVAIGWNQGVGTLNLDNGGTLLANFVQGGSGNSTFNFNGGVLRPGSGARLNFMANLTAANVMAGAVIDTSTNTIDIAQPLLDGGLGGGLTKNGSGTLLLDGANSYSGTTTVSAGTLGGNGSLAGPLVLQSGATLSPGASIGALTVNNTVNLAAGSTTVMELNKAAAANDQLLGVTTLHYGGTLVLRNLAGTLAVNDTFTLFPAGSYSGSFNSVVSETPGQTITWDTSQLAANGSVKVASAGPAAVTITTAVSGSNLTLSWPATQTGWTLLQQTNPLTVGISTNWVPVPGSAATNQITFPIDPTKGSVFFRLGF